MTDVMQGVRILEVAEHTFVPAASALLSDWGAEVIKIEHVERGDAMRGLASTGVADLGSDVHVLLEHSNRGKKSIGLDLTSDEGIDILYKLAATSDVFLTNKLPGVRKKLRLGLEEIRSANPNIIYVSGTGQGERGPDADKGSYDVLAYWHRSGMALGVKRDDYDHVPGPPAPAFGDSIGAMTIAGGIMGALFHRERTGEGTEVDVSLLGCGLWSMGAAMALSQQFGVPWAPPGHAEPVRNPLVGVYETSDDEFLSFCCLQAAKYWAEACTLLGLDDLASDDRFADAESLAANTPEAADLLRAAIAEQPLDVWVGRLEGFSGQWTVVQSTLQAAEDPQTVANGMMVDCENAGGVPFKLAGAPVQFGGTPPQAKRAPDFNEHGDEILAELGLDTDAVIDLKVKGVVA
jgi:crotonobetainyl-CoA:carnitine CoA-transferase CaiB-like acyl-CoA transferase